MTWLISAKNKATKQRRRSRAGLRRSGFEARPRPLPPGAAKASPWKSSKLHRQYFALFSQASLPFGDGFSVFCLGCVAAYRVKSRK